MMFLAIVLSYLLYSVEKTKAAICGCKVIRPCYEQMVNALKHGDEATCVSDANISTSMLTVYLAALQKFCPSVTEIYTDKVTNQRRVLYEVVIRTENNLEEAKVDERPVFLIDAGQEAGVESVGLALYVIEQLVACKDNEESISKVRWVILPCTNPDGLEVSRSVGMSYWRKNARMTNNVCYGIDISKNFPGVWKSCPVVNNYCSQIYAGTEASTENETIFIQDIMSKYRKDIKVYLSLRRNGHSLNFPYGHDMSDPPGRLQIEQAATIVTNRINQRAGNLHLFTNQSLYDLNAKAICGHSVDFAYQHMNIPYTFEMRVFLGSNLHLMSKFQALPRGYEASLRNAYGSGIKEFYNLIVKEKQTRHS